jgi:excisionase family DNA binding protein
MEIPEAMRGKLTLSVDETATLLGVGRQQVYESVRTGAIPSLRMGRRVIIPMPMLLAMFGYEEPRPAEPSVLPPLVEGRYEVTIRRVGD